MSGNLAPPTISSRRSSTSSAVRGSAGYRRPIDRAIPIAEAIINTRWNGVSINVFVEQDYIRTKLEKVPKPLEPDAASGETQAEAIDRLQWRSDQATADEDLQRKRESLAINRVILSALLRNGIEVKGDFNPRSSIRSSLSATTAGRRRRTRRS
jgi:hypothetical protein